MKWQLKIKIKTLVEIFTRAFQNHDLIPELVRLIIF